MLLHDFLRRKSAILTKAKADIDNLLTEIIDVPTRTAVDDWDLGDPISDEYPQVHQKNLEAGEFGKIPAGEAKPGGIPPEIAALAKMPGPGDIPAPPKDTQADEGAQPSHQPEGQPQHEPAGGNTPA